MKFGLYNYYAKNNSCKIGKSWWRSYYSYKVDGFYEIGECRLDIAYLTTGHIYPPVQPLHSCLLSPTAAEEFWCAYQRHGVPS